VMSIGLFLLKSNMGTGQQHPKPFLEKFQPLFFLHIKFLRQTRGRQPAVMTVIIVCAKKWVYIICLCICQQLNGWNIYEEESETSISSCSWDYCYHIWPASHMVLAQQLQQCLCYHVNYIYITRPSMPISSPGVYSAGSSNLWKGLTELLFLCIDTWFCVHIAYEYLDLCTTKNSRKLGGLPRISNSSNNLNKYPYCTA
jgi:hypothetical protein